MIPQFWLDRFKEYRLLIEAASGAHGIPAAVICGVISQESAWDTYSMRYEPDFTARYVVPTYPKSSPTFRVQAGSSWGLMQLMGLVSRELGYRDNYLYLLKPEVGIEWGCRKLAALTKRYGVGRGRLDEYGTRGILGQDVISAYNQGGDKFLDLDGDGVHDLGEEYRNEGYVDAVMGFAAAFEQLLK